MPTLKYSFGPEIFAHAQAIGRLEEVPGVFSQGESLVELEDNVRDAYAMLAADERPLAHAGVQRKEISIEVASSGATSSASKRRG